MYAVVNDSSKFKRLSTDPTVAREQNLIKLLNRLLKEKSITEQFFKMSCPKGSNPGRLYGLPKIHKDNIPLRPVLSAIGTFNYGLGKALTNILSDIIEKENMVRDPFSFVEELKASPKSFSNYKMVSFDISSLYMNVPLDETIEIILKNLYETRATPPTIQRDDMKQLLIFATKNTHFLFDKNLYDQVDRVSMGSPLAPLLAEIFLQDFEKTHSSSFTSMDIVYWKRYVDDTFVLIDSTFSAKDICTKLSQFHKSIKFTCEEEAANTNTLSFLNILIQKQPGIGFATKVHRKETFFGLITKWSSFVPKAYKYNAISTLVYRAIKLCSSYNSLHQEFRFIRKLGTKNGYPINFVNSIIRRQLDLLYNPPAHKPPTPNTDIVVVRVPYFGLSSHVYAKRITSAVSKQCPQKRIRVIYDVTNRIGTGFTNKDKIPTLIKSGVVYEAQCSKCSDSYIGKTYRHLKTRINEHLAEQKKSAPPTYKKTPPVVKRNASSIQSHTTTKIHMTRFKTGKLPQPKYNLSNLSERFGAKWIFGGSTLGAGILTLLIPLAARTHAGLLIAVRILIGAFEAPALPSASALWGRWIPPFERSVVPPLASIG
ncbi:unnamed protein product [Rotaria sp. Silwood2]|nr:unnamed protein product [Rotaria sp. Silwood2]